MAYPPNQSHRWRSADSRSSRFASLSRLSFFQHRIQLKGGSSVTLPLGIVLVFPAIVIILIIILFVRHTGPRDPYALPPDTSVKRINDKYDKVFVEGCLDPTTQYNHPRASAAIVLLARNQDLEGVIQSVKSLERHFNRWFHYPYVVLNDGYFNETFVQAVQNHTSGEVEFGLVEDELWGFPDWADPDVIKEGIAKQGDDAIMYGGMESYHHMCRFYSGKFYHHPLLQKYKWYWRLEPEVKFFCDITYDPFIHMERENKTYGFTIAVKELKETVPNIFRYASAYKRKYNIKSRGMWEMFLERPDEELSDEELHHRQRERIERGEDKFGNKKEDKPKKDEVAMLKPQEVLNIDPQSPPIEPVDEDAMDGDKYNMCHFWSNFEIARLDWFRSKEYNDFFEMMDRSGGFWMERWGDAPIHSLAVGALLAPSDVHYFRDFGYRHTTIGHCPANAPNRQLERIPYLEEMTESERERKKEDDYWAKYDREKENGVGCRCRCDADIPEVESKEGSCAIDWVRVAGGWTEP